MYADWCSRSWHIRDDTWVNLYASTWCHPLLSVSLDMYTQYFFFECIYSTNSNSLSLSYKFVWDFLTSSIPITNHHALTHSLVYRGRSNLDKLNHAQCDKINRHWITKVKILINLLPSRMKWESESSHISYISLLCHYNCRQLCAIKCENDEELFFCLLPSHTSIFKHASRHSLSELTTQ